MMEEPRIAVSMDDWRDQLDYSASQTGSKVFEMKTKPLKQGRTNLPLAATKNMTIVLKCYAEGG